MYACINIILCLYDGRKVEYLSRSNIGYRPSGSRTSYCACKGLAYVWSLLIFDIEWSSMMWDTIVVGAGIEGSSAAYSLAQRGRKTLLLEQVHTAIDHLCTFIHFASIIWSLVLGDIVDTRFHLLLSMLPFRGLTLLSVAFVHCAQTAEDIVTISFAYDSPMSLQIALKFVLHRSTLTPQILPQTDPPLLVWASETLHGQVRPNG